MPRSLPAYPGDLKGQLGDSPQSLREGLDRISQMRRRVQRLDMYAQLKADKDTRVGENQERQQKGAVLQSHFQEAIAFFDPEIQAVGRARIEAFEAADPGLALHLRPPDEVDSQIT